jgi:hypothetical protein
MKYPDITVELTGNDGNAFAVLGNVSRVLRKNEVSKQEIDDFMTEATSGDYDNLLQTCMKWVNVV